MPDFETDNGPDPYDAALAGLTEVLSWMHLDGAHYRGDVPVDVLAAEHFGLVQRGGAGRLRSLTVWYEPTATGWSLAAQGTDGRWRLSSKVST